MLRVVTKCPDIFSASTAVEDLGVKALDLCPLGVLHQVPEWLQQVLSPFAERGEMLKGSVQEEKIGDLGIFTLSEIASEAVQVM